MKNKVMMILALLVVVCTAKAEQQVSIVPKPSEMKVGEGSFKISSKTVITYDSSKSKRVAVYLQKWLKQKVGFTVQLVDAPVQKGAINLVSTANASKEAYQLSSTKSEVTIQAGSESGLFYGVQSLLQVLPVEVFGKEHKKSLELPVVEITDAPAYEYRGMHLDVSRHFYTVEEIKKFLDYLAMHKFNVFHWHLIDDGGWRLEIKKYPKLTEFGAWRAGGKGYDAVKIEFPLEQNPNAEVYGGFYTQEDAKEIIAYAAERQIRVIPEIELPGHGLPALDTHPHLRCKTDFTSDGEGWTPDRQNSYCAGNEGSFEFLENVLSEVFELFPDQSVHIGGDEVIKTFWKACPKCDKRMKDNKLKDVYELQSYFVKRIEAFFQKNGKNMIGWDEIVKGGLAENATVMYWISEERTRSALKTGNPVIMTPLSHCYFDYYQGEPENEPRAIGGFLPLEKVYTFDPMLPGLTDEEQKLIIGGQANIWTEYIENFAHLEYMSLPRMSAMAESLWTDVREKDYTDFTNRMVKQYARYDQLGTNYRVAPPAIAGKSLAFVDEIAVELKNPAVGEIRYTLDGSEPTAESTLYTEALKFTETSTVKAKVFNAGRASVTVTVFAEKQTYREALSEKKTEKGVNASLYLGSFGEYGKIAQGEKVKDFTHTGLDIKFADAPKDNFGVIYTAFIKIEKDGVYSFSTRSDDGSVLWIGDKKVVDNDGWHGPQTREGQVALKAGFHPIKVTYFEGAGGEELTVKVNGKEITDLYSK